MLLHLFGSWINAVLTNSLVHATPKTSTNPNPVHRFCCGLPVLVEEHGRSYFWWENMLEVIVGFLGSHAVMLGVRVGVLSRHVSMDFYHIRLVSRQECIVGQSGLEPWQVSIGVLSCPDGFLACQHGLLGVSFGVLPSQDWGLDMYQ